MIGELLEYLRARLNDALVALPSGEGLQGPDEVQLIAGDVAEPISFAVGAVSLLLSSVQEERIMRDAEPYRRVEGQGKVAAEVKHYAVNPEIRLTLNLLYVARFKEYRVSWNRLAEVMDHYRIHRVYEPPRQTELDEAQPWPKGLERLSFELISLSLAEQNELRNALKMSAHPFLLYRVNLVALRDPTPKVSLVAVAKDKLSVETLKADNLETAESLSAEAYRKRLSDEA